MEKNNLGKETLIQAKFIFDKFPSSLWTLEFELYVNNKNNNKNYYSYHNVYGHVLQDTCVRYIYFILTEKWG